MPPAHEHETLISKCEATIHILMGTDIAKIQSLLFENEYGNVYRMCIQHRQHLDKLIARMQAVVSLRIALVGSAARRRSICNMICDIYMFYDNTIRHVNKTQPMRDWFMAITSRISNWTRVVKLLPYLTFFSRRYLASIAPGGKAYLACKAEFDDAQQQMLLLNYKQNK